MHTPTPTHTLWQALLHFYYTGFFSSSSPPLVSETCLLVKVMMLISIEKTNKNISCKIASCPRPTPPGWEKFGECHSVTSLWPSFEGRHHGRITMSVIFAIFLYRSVGARARVKSMFLKAASATSGL